jgi:hypothetical protein
VLVGYLKNEHTTTTWAVVERNLVSSMWCVLRRGSSARSHDIADTKPGLFSFRRRLPPPEASIHASEY